MKIIKTTGALLFGGLITVLMSCGGEMTTTTTTTTMNSEGEMETVETVSTSGGESASMDAISMEDFIAEANELGQEAFDKKYPRDSEIVLMGEVRAPATWGDKITAKFGTGLNDLPVSADFMFADNGGSKEACKEIVKGGEELHFKGTMSGSFFDEDGHMKRCTIKDCTGM